MEVEAPKPGNFDTSHTYEIKGLAMKLYKFKSIKSYLKVSPLSHSTLMLYLLSEFFPPSSFIFYTFLLPHSSSLVVLCQV